MKLTNAQAFFFLYRVMFILYKITKALQNKVNKEKDIENSYITIAIYVVLISHRHAAAAKKTTKQKTTAV